MTTEVFTDEPPAGLVEAQRGLRQRLAQLAGTD